MKPTAVSLSLFVLLSLLPACSSTSPSSSPSVPQTITGTVLAPNGVDPVPGAEVYIPAGGAALLAADDPAPFGDTATALVRTVTDASGNFVLEGAPEGPVPVVISSGLFQKRLEVDAESGSTALSATLTTLPSSSNSATTQAPRFAVVTGDWDQMEDVLAKFGMGQADELGCLVLGTEPFQIYRTGTPHTTTVSALEDPVNGPYLAYLDWPETYPTVEDLFASIETMQQYDVIILNCGVNSITPDYPSPTDIVYPLITDPLVQARIHDFVQQGGRLYVTDRSYDWIEQVFPNYIQFQNGGDLPTSTPEPLDAAEVGESGYADSSDNWVDFTTDGTLLDTGLSDWLSGLGVLNTDGTVHLESFWGGWSVMVGPHTGTQGNQCKTWVEGPVMWNPDTVTFDPANIQSGVRPLVISFHYGLGKVIYTSYHSDAEPHPGFKPQERILEYLLLESAR